MTRRSSILGGAFALTAFLAAGAPAHGAAVYTANASSDDVSVMPLTAGALGPATETSTGMTGGKPYGIVFGSLGPSLYVSGSNMPGQLAAFGVAGDDTLFPNAAHPQVSADLEPDGLAVAPDGQTLYSANANGSDVTWYSLGVDGTPYPATGAPSQPAGTHPETVAVNPSGKAVYVGDDANHHIYQFNVGAGGALTPMSTPSIDVGSGVDPRAIRVSPDGSALYFVNVNGSVVEYPLQSDGSIDDVPSPATVPDPNDPGGIVITPDGKYLYVPGGPLSMGDDGHIYGYALTASGPQALAGSPYTVPKADGYPLALTVSPVGDHLYAATDGGNVEEFALAPAGALTRLGAVGSGAGTYPQGITETPDTGPAAAFSTSAADLTLGDGVSFDASASTGGTTAIGSELWSFGDGTTATGPAVAHTYTAAGTYTVTLTLTDAGDHCSTSGPYTGIASTCLLDPGAAVTHTVTVNGPPANTGTTTGTTPTTTTPGSATIPPPSRQSPGTPGSDSFTVGGATVTIHTPAAANCYDRNARYTVSLSSTSLPKASGRFKRAAFFLDRGVAHARTVTRRGKRVKVTTYRPNATARRLPVTKRLTLTGLKPGDHSLKIVVLFTQRRHGRTVTVTRRLNVPLPIC